MRQIKFRAWSVDTNEMIPWEEAMFPEWFDDAQIYVMQFTGLKDKNGVEIYEGDILDVKYNWVVTWKYDGWYGVVKKHHHNTCRLQKLIRNRKRAGLPIEVIGNIHEYPVPKSHKNEKKVQQCNHSIEKNWSGHVAVLSRNQCRNRTKHDSGYCHHHRPYGIT